MAVTVPDFLDGIDLRRIAHVVGFLVLVVVVFAFLAATFPGLALSDDAFVVRSDSMSPAIPAGSVVFVEDVSPAEIQVGDVITFEPGGGENRVTHRVIDVREDGSRQFQTKGDANDDPDPSLVSSEEVVGEVSFHLPLIGYVINFAGSDLGLVALIVVPALALVVLELRDILRSQGSGGDRLR